MTLIDTSSLVHLFRHKGDAAVKRRVSDLLLRQEGVICDLVAVELWMGVASADDGKDVGDLIDLVPVLPTDARVWRLAAQLGRACRLRGKPVPSSDVVIAACAFAHAAEIEAEDGHFTVLRAVHGALGEAD